MKKRRSKIRSGKRKGDSEEKLEREKGRKRETGRWLRKDWGQRALPQIRTQGLIL